LCASNWSITPAVVLCPDQQVGRIISLQLASSDFMAEMVCSALVQETVSRGVSFELGRREEKASQGHVTERVEMAVSELEFALERAMELPIRHLSLAPCSSAGR